MKVKGLDPRFGSKRTMAPAIIRQLGKHTQYFEALCGSMAVLLAKEPSRCETVNDLDGELINLARVIAVEDSAVELYGRLERTLFCEDTLADAKGHLDKKLALPPVDRAYWYFVASWMGRSGEAGLAQSSFSLSVRWSATGGSPTRRFNSAMASIPAWHQRLKDVVILNRDAFKVLESLRGLGRETVCYCDPPYLAETRTSGRYKFDFDSQPGGLFGDDHQRLAELLRELECRVVVSYYDHPRVRELYRGWNFVDCTRHKHLATATSRGSGKVEAPEVLIVNGEAY